MPFFCMIIGMFYEIVYNYPIDTYIGMCYNYNYKGGMPHVISKAQR